MRILFDLRRPYFLNGHAPVIEELQSRGLEVAVCPQQSSQEDAFREFAASRGWQLPFVDSALAPEQPWDLVIVAGGLYGRKYQACRGLGMFTHNACGSGNSRSPYLFDIVRQFDIDAYFAVGPADVALGSKLYPGIWDRRFVAVTGWPKLDELRQRQLDKAEWSRVHNVRASRKNLIICSHWTENSLFKTIGLGVLLQLHATASWNIIVTAHSLLLDQSTNGLRTDMRPILRGMTIPTHMQFIESTDSNALLMMGDAFVCDHSSFICEMAAMDKPLIVYRDVCHDYCDPALEAAILAASSQFSRVQEARTVITAEITQGEHKKEERAALTSYVFANLFEATVPTADAITEAAMEFSSRGLQTRG